MSQLNKVFNVLVKNTKQPGITAMRLSKLSGVPVDSVRKRIYDLRTMEDFTIYTNKRKTNKGNVNYYRLAA